MPTRTRHATRQQRRRQLAAAWLAELGAALGRVRPNAELLHFEGYCDHPGCSVREVHAFLKDYDHTLLARVKAHGGVCCPACGRPLIVHWVRTAAEQDAETQAGTLDDFPF